jgi:hypothetical protein
MTLVQVRLHKLAEWSEALDLGSNLKGGGDSNPTVVHVYHYFCKLSNPQ